MEPAHPSEDIRSARALAPAPVLLAAASGITAAALDLHPYGVAAAAIAVAAVGQVFVMRAIRRAERAGTEQSEALARAHARLDELTGRVSDHGERITVLESVLNAAPLAVVLCDPKGAVTFSNRTADDLFHGGRPLEATNFDAVLDTHPPGMKKAVQSQADVLFTVNRDLGEESYHVSRPMLELNTRRYTLYVIKHLTRELNRQEVAIWKKVIRVISHELNNSLAPMSSLIHSARHILEHPEHAHRLGVIFDTIEERTTHLRTFIEGYARFARIAPPQKVSVEWAPFLEGIAALFHCRIEGEPPPEPGIFDASQLQQALINLVKNALDADSPPERTVIQITRRPNGGVTLGVLDEGKGMTDRVMKQALIPFYSTKKSGAGLGLALCREIVDAHDGAIRLERRSHGGLAVHIDLPPEAQTPPSSDRGADRGDRIRA